GGYALRAYDRWQRLMRKDGRWQLRDPRSAAQIRMNLGTILDTERVKVRMRAQSEPLGEIEEGFAATLTPGDTFLMAGKVVRFESLSEMTVLVSKGAGRRPRIAAFMGTKFATSTQLSDRILKLLAQDRWPELPAHTAEWLAHQREVSRLPRRDSLLFESFDYMGRAHSCVYGFAGRNAMQTLGLLLTRRMEDLGLGPLGFVSTDYAVLIWSIDKVPDPEALFDRRALTEGFESWLDDNAVMRRTFKGAATIAGLIDRVTVGPRKTGRQTLFSATILYDTLMRYDPDHLMIRITREEALRGLVDFGRIEEMLDRTGGRVEHVEAPHVTPFAAPLLLEVGKVHVASGEADERLLAEEAKALMAEAGLD
ncbi:MAG: DNA ligase-associated DEXH box helicase, partial [Pseudooceanicola sp.]|nr:DNA ligase-associated DEXH box helicase [Pseudooceanicola sp.]